MAKYNWLSEWKRLLIVNQKLQYYIHNMLVICFYFLADLADLMRPSLVAPVVAWLCHEDCQDNGSVIEAAGGWAGKCEWCDFLNQI